MILPGAPTRTPRAEEARPRRARPGRARAALGAVAMVGVVGLSACSSGGDSGGGFSGGGAPLSCPVPVAPVAIAVGVRANQPSGDLPAAVRSAAASVVSGASDQNRQPRFSVVTVDGRPSVAGSASYSTDAGNAIAAQDDQNAFLTSLGQELGNVRARNPEVDDLAALDVAGRGVAGGGQAGTVVLVDSGVQTLPPLDFRQTGQLDAPVADTVDFLRSSRALPTLQGATVILAGIGDTAAPQAALSPAQRSSLLSLWTEIAKAAGAACVAVVDQPRSGDAPTDVPPVSVVDVPPPPTVTPGRPTALPDDGSVGFRPSTAEFRDRDAARGVLTPFVQFLQVEPSRRIALTGTSARAGTLAGQVALSTQRAGAVKALMVEAGAPADRITTRGVGSQFPGYVNDVGPDGRQLPGPATTNRKVIVEPSG